MVKIYKALHGLSLVVCLGLTPFIIGCASVPTSSPSPVIDSISSLEKLALDHIRELSTNQAPLAQSSFALLNQLHAEPLAADQIKASAQELVFLQGLGLVTSSNQITDIVQHALNAYQVDPEVAPSCWRRFVTGFTAFYNKEGPVVMAALKEITPVLLKLYAQDNNLSAPELAIVDALNYAVNNADTPSGAIPAVLANVLDSKGNLHKDAHVIISALSEQIAQQASLQEDPTVPVVPATPVLRPVSKLQPAV